MKDITQDELTCRHYDREEIDVVKTITTRILKCKDCEMDLTDLYCGKCGLEFGTPVHTEECIEFYRNQRKNQPLEIN